MRLSSSILTLILFAIHLLKTSALPAQNLLTVQQAVRYAIENNYDVVIAKNEIEIGSINNNWANAGAVPTVSATANKTIGVSNLDQKLNNGTITAKKGSSTQNLNAGISVSWRVFDGFKMFATKKRLEEIEKMGEYRFLSVLNETVFDVVSSYYKIIMLKEQLEATQEQIDLYNDRLQLAQMKFDIGTGAKFEVLEAEVDLNGQKSNALNLQNQIAQEKASLNRIIGKLPDTTFSVGDTILLNPLPPLGEMQTVVNNQNPNVLMAGGDLNILMQQKKEINANRLPSVTLNGNYNFIRSRNSAGFTLYNQSYGPSGSVGVTVPIFNGGLVKKQLQIADIDIKNQRLAIDRVKNDVNTALYNNYMNYHNSIKIIELEIENLTRAQNNIAIAMERYRLLNITTVELRQIQISYNEIKNRLYNALYQAKIAEAGAALLTGSLDFL